MEVKLNKLSNVEKELEVMLSKEEIMPIRDKIVSSWQAKVEIPGFRKGKAPLNLVSSKYAKQIEKDLKESLVSHFYKDAIEKAEVLPVIAPQATDVELISDGSARFKLKIEETPQIKLKKYKGLKAKRKIEDVVEEGEIEQTLENIKKEKTIWKEVEREAKKSDLLIADMNIFKNSKRIDEKKNISILLSDDFPIPGFIDKLLNIRANEKREFEIYVPDNFYDKRIAGADVLFKIKVYKVKEKKEPSVDDEFAKSLGEYKDLEDLKEKIKQELLELKKNNAERDMEQQIIDKLLQETEIEIPTHFLEINTKRIAEDLIRRLLYQGRPREEIEEQFDTIWKQAGKDAVKQIKLYYALEEIAKRENINLAENELDEYLNKVADNKKMNIDDLKQKLKENKQIYEIEEELKRKKALKLVIDEANIENE
jgi:trigger factor